MIGEGFRRLILLAIAALFLATLARALDRLGTSSGLLIEDVAAPVHPAAAPFCPPPPPDPQLYHPWQPAPPSAPDHRRIV